ncbi:MAG: hypothetical protein ABSA44_12635 [Bacteroidota bacterium]|jgi:hypothetical protein
MKHLLFLLVFFLVGCSSSEFATYRPAGSNEANWQIYVNKSAITNNFTVTINDSLVIDKSANIFTGNLEALSKYQGKEIKLLVTYTSGFLGIGAGYEAMVFVNNELACKFKF